MNQIPFVTCFGIQRLRCRSSLSIEPLRVQVNPASADTLPTYVGGPGWVLEEVKDHNFSPHQVAYGSLNLTVTPVGDVILTSGLAKVKVPSLDAEIARPHPAIGGDSHEQDDDGLRAKKPAHEINNCFVGLWIPQNG